ncbi:MAG: NADH-quinone oxidoreductase subunit G [Acidobacteria bacterium]|nr:MAG: NADH-quinone oxidoreductase subunit G [Acidobacteriota bacterium]
MAKVWIDGKTHEVDPSRNLLDVCLSLKLDLPYFCWHPAMGSVGACRQCAVKQFRDEADKAGRLVMACMTPAAEGTRISIQDTEARSFRAEVIEWLMVNHPHDCPICDEGGECHLQDMTVMTGHNYRRFRFRKRTYRNQYLGPFINHEMNRCIQCYRCVRFYRGIAGGRDLQAFASRDHVYFGRHEEGVLESEFSGNLVEVCPTGVFTDRTLKRHYTRKWDLQTAPSVCVHCGLGCNTIPGERYGELRRIRTRYNGHVNGYFLCDRGRYGYEFANHERRLRGPLLPRGPDRPAEPIGRDEAIRRLASLISDPAKLIGIGSPRASLEANFALRALVGPERFCLGVVEQEARLLALVLQILRNGPARSPSLREVEGCDAVLVLGEDATNTAPLLALALRESVRQQPLKLARPLAIPLWNDAAVRELVQDQKGPFFLAAPAAGRLDEIATRTFRAAPEEIARLGFAVAHELDPASPEVPGLADEVRSEARVIASALRSAERPLVVSGTSLGSADVIQAAANVAWALSKDGKAADLTYTVPECNSLGLALLGGGSLEAASRALSEGNAETVVILENDLYRRAESPVVDRLLSSARHVVVIDCLAHDTAARAELVLPAGAFAESDGTLVNNEGRAQRFYQVFVPAGEIQESWRWLRDAMAAAGRVEAAGWKSLDDITSALAAAVPIFRDILRIAPGAGFRVAGERIPRASPRFSGRTAMLAHLSVHEPKPPDDPDSPLSFSMEGYEGPPPASLIPRFWAPGWNSDQSLHRFQEEVNGPLLGGDPGLRLIEPPPTDARASLFDRIPPPFERRAGEFRLVPLYHIFGSDELSALAPGVAELAPAPYLALHPDDAREAGIADGGTVEIGLAGGGRRLPVRLAPELARGAAGVPVGLPGMEGIRLPEWGRIVKL